MESLFPLLFVAFVSPVTRSVPEDELADLFAAYSNRPITFEELQTLVLAIEALHHQLGYTLTLAYLPRQVVEDRDRRRSR